MSPSTLLKRFQPVKVSLLIFLFISVAALTQAQYITTFAGTGVYGSTGDGGPALNATLQGASDIVFDRAGNMYISDRGASRIRKVSLIALLQPSPEI